MCQNIFNPSLTLGHLGRLQCFVALGDVIINILMSKVLVFFTTYIHKINPPKCILMSIKLISSLIISI